MTIKIKTTLLTAFFIFGLLTGLQAQDKYEFAELIYNSGGDASKLFLVQSGQTRIEIPVAKSEYNSKIHDNSPLFNYLPKMITEGWEILYINDQVAAIVIVLKRKKQP